MIVLDASAAIELLLKISAGRRIQTRSVDPREEVHAPHLIDMEVAHVLRRLAETGADAAFCRATLEDWLAFPVRLYPEGPILTRVWELRSNVPANDAVYIALAEALAAPLVTQDRKMAAGGHNATVELI